MSVEVGTVRARIVDNVTDRPVFEFAVDLSQGTVSQGFTLPATADSVAAMRPYRLELTGGTVRRRWDNEKKVADLIEDLYDLALTLRANGVELDGRQGYNLLLVTTRVAGQLAERVEIG